MTPEELIAAGARHIHWNPNWNGGFHEYYFPLYGSGLDYRDSRLGVRFGEYPDHPVRAWLTMPHSHARLDGIASVEELLTMYRFVAGRDWNPATYSED